MTKVIKAKFNNVTTVVLVRLFLVTVFLIFFLYVYFLSNIILAVIENKNNSKNIQIISQENQGLEKTYFNLVEKIDMDYARQIGFVDQPQKVDYIVRQAAVAYGR